ncbi:MULTISPECIES: restriction endonuclease subunit S [unclassified Alteromonas]|uniref:restriction endonuclease subunit S n=1 Tax=unclassified Alteromonas TaxID=2614992 RepID=UPI001EF3D0FB|nr:MULTISPECIES: restriction endonuclease subunit S [unclassified Alteromonas]MCG7638814.1 restriction endonuclease subunit S [Alteromonas sp. CNT1-28]MCG7813497.1 restriction endonuclease subunit S [Alteromonas sp. MCA-1]
MNLEIDKSEWKEVKLGDVAFEYSKRINEPGKSGFDRFVGNSNIEKWDLNIKSWESSASVTSAMKFFDVGDYLLVRRSLYASDFRERAPRADFSGVCSGDILTIKENPEFIYDGYLAAVLNSKSLWKFVVANASGSITRRIKWKDLENFTFLLPPKSLQKKLSLLIWSLEELSTNKRTVLRSLFNLRSSFFSEKTNCEVNREFGQSSWVRKKIKDLAKVVRGSSPRPAGSPLYFDGDYLPWITVAALTNKSTPEIKIEDVPSYLTEIGATKTRILPANTVLLSNSGYSLGVPAILPFEAGANDGVAAFLNLKGLSREYLYYFLDSKTKYFRESIAAGADQPNLNTSRIGNIEIAVPDMETQQSIVSDMKQIDCAILDIKKSLKAEKSLLLSILSKVDLKEQG